MTVFSHNTRVETLDRREWPGRNVFGNADSITKVTQADGDVEYLVYASGSDPFSFTDEAAARAEFESICALRVGI